MGLQNEKQTNWSLDSKFASLRFELNQSVVNERVTHLGQMPGRHHTGPLRVAGSHMASFKEIPLYLASHHLEKPIVLLSAG